MKKSYFYVGVGCLILVGWLAVVGFNKFNKPSLLNSVELQKQLLAELIEKIEPIFINSNIKIFPQVKIVENAIELVLLVPEEKEVELNTKVTGSKLEVFGTATTSEEEVIEKDNGHGGVMTIKSKKWSNNKFNFNLDVGIPIDEDAMTMEQGGNHYKIILPLK